MGMSAIDLVEARPAEGFELSPQQRLVHRLESSAPEEPCLTRCDVRIFGPTTGADLRRACLEVMRRHEILRTASWRMADMDLPLQVVLPEPRLEFRDGAREGSNGGAASPHEPIGSRDPSAVVVLEVMRVFDQEHRLTLVAPSWLADCAGLRVAVHEIARLAGGLTASDSGDPLQYADVAAWLNATGEGGLAVASASFWRRTAPPELLARRLPFELDPSGPSRAESLPVPISPETRAALSDLAELCGTSWREVLLAGWQILLWRHAEGEQLLTAVTVDGRDDAELAETVGPLVRRVPIGTALAPGMRVREAVARARAATEHAREWAASFSFSDWRAAPDEQGAPEQFDLCFESVELPDRIDAGRLSYEIEYESARFDRFGLLLRAVLRSEGLALEMAYDSGRFERDAVVRVAARFARLLDALEPDAAVERLPIVAPDEHRWVVEELNSTAVEFPAKSSVLDLFATYALEARESSAVVAEEASVSYGELDARSNRLARALIPFGAGPEVPVALCVDRSVDLIVGLLGILKSGAAYVPLDPSLPRARLEQILNESGATILVTQEALGRARPEFHGPIVCLDAASLESVDPSGLGIAPAPEHLAYILFTSGSTGRPKGVEVEHRQLLNYVQAILTRLDLAQPASFAFVSTIGADLGNTAIFPALCSGGCLHVIADHRTQDGERLAEYFRGHHIDCLKIVPAHLGALMAGSDPAGVLPRRWLILGGESSDWERIADIRRVAPQCRILNHYGPTETTVGALTFSVVDADRPDSATVPIGWPLPNVRAYVLDGEGAPVGAWQRGEIYIGGRGVARGYRRSPELTAERFIPDPFSGREGDRLYRTGDRGRLLADGSIEFLGRIDRQVKIRGHRIELGEVECALVEHPQVRECAVVATEEAGGGCRLVAFAVSEADGDVKPEDLSAFLRDRLPDAMVPSRILIRAALPLTANGKIDRDALVVEARMQQARQEPFMAPRTPTEVRLAEIWREVLGLERVGIHDNFFELGGDSILSIQVVGRASRAGIRLMPRSLLEHPTIGALASVAERASIPSQSSRAAVGCAPLTPIQARFFEIAAGVPHHYNLAFLLETPASLRLDLLEEAVRLCAEHHEALRLRFAREAGAWCQRLDADVPPTELPSFDLSGRTAEERDTAIEHYAGEIQASLDPFAGPVWRIAHFALGSGQRGRLLCVFHHLVFDGVSLRIFLDDLAAIYAQLVRGLEPAQPPKTMPFLEWALRLGELAEEPAEPELTYWRRSLDGSAGSLPTDFHVSLDGNTEGSVEIVATGLGEDDTRRLLRATTGRGGAFVKAALLGSVAAALSRWTGETSSLIDVEGHGREPLFADVDVSRTIGWFTSVYPLRVSAPADAAREGMIDAVAARLAAVPRGGIGYGLLRYLGSERVRAQMAALPQAEVVLNYLGQFDQVFAAGGPFAVAREPIGPLRSPLGVRPHLLQIFCGVEGGRLQVEWRYSGRVHRRETIANLARDFLAALGRFVGSAAEER